MEVERPIRGTTCPVSFTLVRKWESPSSVVSSYSADASWRIQVDLLTRPRW